MTEVNLKMYNMITMHFYISVQELNKINPDKKKI